MVVIDGTPIDIATSLTYTAESETTSFPVEEGADLTDHVRLGQLKIELECVVSDTPIGKIAADSSRGSGVLGGAVLAALGASSSESGVSSLPYGQTTFDRLLEIRDARKPVTVTTSRGDFENMVLSFSVPDAISTSGGLVFTASLVQVQVAENERVTLAIAATPRGKGKQNLGALALDPVVYFLPTSPVLVFTMKLGQTETKYWEQNPNKVLVASTKAGMHYKAENWTYADGIVDARGYQPIDRKTFAAMPDFIRKMPAFDRGAAHSAQDMWIKAHGQQLGAGGAANDFRRGNRF